MWVHAEPEADVKNVFLDSFSTFVFQGLHLRLQLVALAVVVWNPNSGPPASTLPSKPSPQPLVLFLSDFTEVEFMCHKSHLLSVYCLVNFVNRLSHERPT